MNLSRATSRSGWACAGALELRLLGVVPHTGVLLRGKCSSDVVPDRALGGYLLVVESGRIPGLDRDCRGARAAGVRPDVTGAPRHCRICGGAEPRLPPGLLQIAAPYLSRSVSSSAASRLGLVCCSRGGRGVAAAGSGGVGVRAGARPYRGARAWSAGRRDGRWGDPARGRCGHSVYGGRPERVRGGGSNAGVGRG
jgi:hypothetical protein